MRLTIVLRTVLLLHAPWRGSRNVLKRTNWNAIVNK